MPNDSPSPLESDDDSLGVAHSRWRLWVARALLVVVPVILIIGFGETLLWVFDAPRLVDHPSFYGINRMRICRSMPEKIEELCAPEYFSADGDRISIYVYGGSSVEGYPLFEMVPFARRMQRMLNREFPNTYSVHNLGASCRDSIYVRKCADRVQGKSSDIYVLYAGHNDIANFVVPNPRIRILSIEYPRLFSIQATLAKSRIFSAVSSLVRTDEIVFSMVKRRLPDPDWGIARQIALDVYERNIRTVIDAAADLEINVILLTMVSNLHEFPYKREDWSKDVLKSQGPYSEQLQQWLRHYEAGIELFEAEDRERALREFKLARDEYMGGRSPSALNEQIREFATEYSHVYLVDFEKTLDQLSLREGAGVGCNFFGEEDWCDQFHPNARTHDLIAREIVKQLRVMRRSPRN